VRVALTALVLWFGVACATSAPPVPMSFAPTPREMSLPGVHPPLAFAPIADADPAPLLDQAPPESASLLYARAVLEKRGAKLDAVQREGVARALMRAEAENGLSVLMTLSLIEQESRFDPRAAGPTGSLGLMQLQPVTAREVARQHGLAWQSDRTLYDPVQNVRIGLAYLGALLDRFGSTDHAMAAYNIGPGALSKLLKTRPLRHGPYLKKVHARAESMRAEFGHPETAIGG
jgi:soluble lytic murein transglycosylase-like protein